MGTDVDHITTSPRVPAVTVTQTTAVEQARARAEVEAAVYVAQKMPRDIDRAVAEMEDACGRLSLADRAFYSVPKRGNKKSVHLARELARIWGNIDYGVHELRRDEEAGMSEVRAFAWDQQANVRVTRTFQVPHQRMKTIDGVPTRQPLINLSDVYLNNQNIGARAVRECLFAAMPEWFSAKAEALCRETLQSGGGTPLADRVKTMIDGFRAFDVTVYQLEQRIGRTRAQWNVNDVTQMGIVYRSIQAGDVTADDEFPPKRVTADEITGGQARYTAVDEPVDGPAAPPFSKTEET